MGDSTNSTLMCVHAHPDDESIGTGGTLAKYGAMGVETVVVYCTRGEEGDLNNPEFAAPDPEMSIEEIRMAELEKALAVLNISRTFFLGYRDSGMAGTHKNFEPGAFARADVESAAHRLARIIQEVRPQVMATYNEKGLYGHPDHIMANRVTTRAIELAQHPLPGDGVMGLPWYVKKLYYTAVSLEGLRTLQRLALAQGRDFGLDPEFLGTPEASITTRIDVRDFLSQKFKAILCHESQIGPKHFFRGISEDRRLEFFGYEDYVRVGKFVLKQKETDLFEGL